MSGGGGTTRAVEAALRGILQSALDSSKDVGHVPVVSAPSAAAGRGLAGPERRLDLLLYRMVPGPPREPALPWRGVPRAGKPHQVHAPLVDLHYLVTAYSPDELECHSILEIAVWAVHEHPVLTVDGMNVTTAMETLSTSELASLWSAMQAPLRLSVPFVVPAVPMGPRSPSGATEARHPPEAPPI